MASGHSVYSRYNTILRVELCLLAFSTLFFLKDFAAHTYVHFTGSISLSTITGQWHVVALNIAVFLSFLIPLSFRRKVDWKEYSLVVAFFVSLFVEMYGIPLTMLFTAGVLSPSPPDASLRFVYVLDLLGVKFHFTVPMIYGTLLMIIGTVLVVIGWVTLYRGIKKGRLVTTGIYSMTRNPQYLGFIFIILGWLAGWPTVLTVIFSSVLIIFYIRLCKVEEKEVSDLDGYRVYKKRVPLLI